MKVDGTNCGNCLWADLKTKRAIKPSELNAQGGRTPQTEDEMERAKEHDLITLPGKAIVAVKFPCTDSQIDQDVTERNCCALWDANGVFRPWEKKK